MDRASRWGITPGNIGILARCLHSRRILARMRDGSRDGRKRSSLTLMGGEVGAQRRVGGRLSSGEGHPPDRRRSTLRKGRGEERSFPTTENARTAHARPRTCCPRPRISAMRLLHSRFFAARSVLRSKPQRCRAPRNGRRNSPAGVGRRPLGSRTVYSEEQLEPLALDDQRVEGGR